MIFDYGFSIAGKSHLQMGKPCQDAYCIRRLENGWYVGAAADGVGSRANAEEGAALAVKTAVDFVCEYMPYDYSVISTKSMLRTALNYTMKTIIRHAEEKEVPVENFDTTLSLVIYDGKRIIYAHSGDGAIIGLTVFGELIEITKRQKAEDGISLIPLRAGYKAWEIDTCEEELAGVMIVTDGVLDAMSPYLLKVSGEGVPEYGRGRGLYVPIGTFLADPAGVPEEEEGQVILRERMEAYVTADMDYDSEFFYERLQEIYSTRTGEQAEELIAELKKYNYPVSLMQGSQDDKTVVGFMNTEAVLEAQPPGYYKDADWIVYQEHWDRKAYPGLYAEEQKLKEGSRIIKWMKNFTRLEPAVRPGNENCEEKADEGSDVLQ